MRDYKLIISVMTAMLVICLVGGALESIYADGGGALSMDPSNYDDQGNGDNSSGDTGDEEEEGDGGYAPAGFWEELFNFVVPLELF